MFTFGYQLFTILYPKLIGVWSFFNPKAKLWIEGRKQYFSRLSTALKDNDKKIIWMHCASVGEYEQGLPVLEVIKKQCPDYAFLITFFSPSGYEAKKNDSFPDWVFYLPMDSPGNAKKMLQMVQPHCVIFVKYEFWYYYLKAISEQQIPLILISAIFRTEQVFFQPYGKFYRQMLNFFTLIFVQDDNSEALLQTIDLTTPVLRSGDTRFDRVVEIAENKHSFPDIDLFVQKFPTIIAGSTWIDDDETLAHFVNYNPQYRYIIAPHEIDTERLEECISFYKNAQLYSVWKNQPLHTTQVLVMDNMGMLSSLYGYAAIAYVGGGLNANGVHNVLEAAVYYKPVVFGDVYEKYKEAVDLIALGGAFEVATSLALEQIFKHLFADKSSYDLAASIAGNYVKDSAGASLLILKTLSDKKIIH